MSHSIAISDDLYERLLQQARRLAVTPEAVAESVLRRELAGPEPAWRQDIEAVVARIRRGAAGQAAEAIEADITEAARETRQLRRGDDRRR